MIFTHPEPEARRTRIYPVFIPFAGCPVRCVFCSQSAQTGARFDGMEAVLASIQQTFCNTPATFDELAFFGGTFTSLPFAAQSALLDYAVTLKKAGRIQRIRCSTRPDSVSASSLARLRDMGLDVVELGIQSFDTCALTAARRGYDGATAEAGCRMVLESGLTLGVQLMPGMPGMTPDIWGRDVRQCAALHPSFVRLYPCLVLAETELANQFAQHEFVPWSLQAVLELLPPALLTLWQSGVRVIRMGLAPQNGLQSAVLAGPQHPALGQRLRSRALYLYILSMMAGAEAKSPLRLYAPRRFQGEFLGHRRELAPDYAALGLHAKHIQWWDKHVFDLASIPAEA